VPNASSEAVLLVGEAATREIQYEPRLRLELPSDGPWRPGAGRGRIDVSATTVSKNTATSQDPQIRGEGQDQASAAGHSRGTSGGRTNHGGACSAGTVFLLARQGGARSVANCWPLH